MTLLAIHAREDGATVMSDGWSYAPAGNWLGRSNKVLPLPGLDAVVAVQGSTVFGDSVHAAAAMAAHGFGTFDTLADHFAALLPSLWLELAEGVEAANAQDGTAVTLADSVVWLVGYSDDAGRFVARGYRSDRAFLPFDHEGLYVHPSPLSVRPSDLELERLERFAAEKGTSVDLDAWRAQPTPPPPTSDGGWFKLAQACRSDRAMVLPQTGIKVLVGGPLTLTEVTQGGLLSRRAEVFDESPDELARLHAGTVHPLGQAGPCPCGSGERYVDCHLAPHADQACLCGSGQPFAGCCSILAGERTPVEQVA